MAVLDSSITKNKTKHCSVGGPVLVEGLGPRPLWPHPKYGTADTMAVGQHAVCAGESVLLRVHSREKNGLVRRASKSITQMLQRGQQVTANGLTYRITYRMRPPQGTGSASGVKQT